MHGMHAHLPCMSHLLLSCTSPCHTHPLPCRHLPTPAMHAPCHTSLCHAHLPPLPRMPPMTLWHAVNERSVRILLECILVKHDIINDFFLSSRVVWALRWNYMHYIHVKTNCTKSILKCALFCECQDFCDFLVLQKLHDTFVKTNWNWTQCILLSYSIISHGYIPCQTNIIHYKSSMLINLKSRAPWWTPNILSKVAFE